MRNQQSTVAAAAPKKVAPKRKPLKQTKFWANRYIHVMIWITVIYFIVFRYWPMTWLAIAFKDFKILKGFIKSSWVGFKNFEDIFRNMPYFLQMIKNTLSLNLLSLLFGFPAPIIFAILLNELSSQKFKRTVQTISYLPHFLSTVVIVGMTTTLLSPTMGLVNKLIYQFGGESKNFLADPNYFWPIMIIVGIWQGIGWSAIIYLSAITGIDPSLYEAAEIDGAGRWKKILHITLPGIRNTIVILLILQIGNLMSVDTEKIFLFQNERNLRVSEMFPTYVYKLGIVNANYSRATAIGLFSSVISLVLVLIANALSRKYSEISII